VSKTKNNRKKEKTFLAAMMMASANYPRVSVAQSYEDRLLQRFGEVEKAPFEIPRSYRKRLFPPRGPNTILPLPQIDTNNIHTDLLFGHIKKITDLEAATLLSKLIEAKKIEMDPVTGEVLIKANVVDILKAYDRVDEVDSSTMFKTEGGGGGGQGKCDPIKDF
jgi:hypothetical protein